MKKTFVIVMAIALTACMLFSACGGANTTTTAAATTTAATAAATTTAAAAAETTTAAAAVATTAAATTATTATTTAAAAAATTTAAAQAGADGFDENGLSGVNEFPFTREVTELKVAAPYNPVVEDYDTNAQTLKILEDTNVKIVWDILPQSGYEERINLMIASGQDLPDVFGACTSSFTTAMLAALGGQGIIASLNDLIDKWQYNIAMAVEQYPSMLIGSTAPDGNIYSLGSIGPSEAMNVAQRFWINTRFLEALNMDIPTTTDEYYNYLVAVKTQDPNGNGKADEIPLTAAMGAGYPWNSNIDGFLMNPFIYSDTINGAPATKRREHLDANGVIVYEAVQEGYKEGLQYLHKFYAEGLMGSDIFTNTQELMTSLVENEDALIVGSLPSGGPHMFANTAGERRKDFQILPPLAGPDGTRQTYYNRYVMMGAGQFVVNNASDKKDIAIKLADYMYTEEFWMWGRYGIEGEHWRKPPEGTIAYNGQPAPFEIIPDTIVWGQPQNTYVAGALGIAWTRYPSYWGANTSGDPFHLESVLWNATVIYNDYRFMDVLPTLFFTDEEGRERQELNNSISTYVEQMLAEFITGTADIDRDWDSYVGNVNNMGLARMLEIDQIAFDRQWAASLGYNR